MVNVTGNWFWRFVRNPWLEKTAKTVHSLNLKRFKEHTKTNNHVLCNNLILKLDHYRSLFDLVVVTSSLVELV